MTSVAREKVRRLLRAGHTTSEVALIAGYPHEFVKSVASNSADEPVVPHDPVNHPPHYTRGGIEVIDAIEAWKLNYHLGNVIKYVARAGHKGDRLTDLKKAQWYLGREIEREEGRLQCGGESGHTYGQEAKP